MDSPIDATLVKKLTDEIEGILDRSVDNDSCEVYFLKVKIAGYYPVLGYGDEVLGFEYMNVNDAWKVGMTCEVERYSTKYFYKGKKNGIAVTKDQLEYKTMFRGTCKEMLILEKILIYTYPLWSGHPNLLRPPGCKIFR